MRPDWRPHTNKRTFEMAIDGRRGLVQSPGRDIWIASSVRADVIFGKRGAGFYTAGDASRGENPMLTSSRYLVTGSPTRCAFCNNPFASLDGSTESWRASDGRHVCSEFCADDAEEAAFKQRHPATLRLVGGDNFLMRAPITVAECSNSAEDCKCERLPSAPQSWSENPIIHPEKIISIRDVMARWTYTEIVDGHSSHRYSIDPGVEAIKGKKSVGISFDQLSDAERAILFAEWSRVRRFFAQFLQGKGLLHLQVRQASSSRRVKWGDWGWRLQLMLLLLQMLSPCHWVKS